MGQLISHYCVTLNLSKGFANISFLLSGSLGDLELGITVKPTAVPLAEALGIVAVVMLVAMVAIVDLGVPRVSPIHWAFFIFLCNTQLFHMSFF